MRFAVEPFACCYRETNDSARGFSVKKSRMRQHLRLAAYRQTALVTCLLAACGIAAPVRAQTAPGSAQTAQQPSPDAPLRLPKDFQIAYPTMIRDGQGSVYIPMDSWIYPALDRLHALGYLDTAFLGLRPWTRLSVFHMLDNQGSPSGNIDDQGEGNDEAEEIYLSVLREVGGDLYFTGEHAELDTVYTRFLGITDTPLNDSYHLGQTIYNDYGRPYQAGINNVTGASGRVEAGRFTLYVRAEYQKAPSATGYSQALGTYLDNVLDDIPYVYGLQAPVTIGPVTYVPAPVQATVPEGPISGVSNFRVLEANLSYHIFKHEISLGKTDHWMGPGQGGAFAWSTNADDIYQFQINRVEPMYVPLLRRVVGPLRYDFFVGSLGGHTQPNHPWVHAEKISIHPTKNLEAGFERTVIWGGRGHEAITLKSFARSFLSFSNVSAAKKFGNTDPGARFSAFDFSYRLPFVRSWLTLYADSFSHDDVNPISAPRRAAIRPGIYLSHVPGVPKLDFRVEGASTDCVTSRCYGAPVSGPGQFYYYEAVQQQGTTNKGFLFTDAIGRADKGGQAWLTYHLSPQEQLQISYRNVKADKNFIPGPPPFSNPINDVGSTNFTQGGGTTQNQFKFDVVKRLVPDVELHAAVQYEAWKAPIYKPGSNSDISIWGQVTWYPHKAHQF